MANAQIVADRNAPGNQQPQIVSTANGLPQVNIQAPSAAGVSRNVYSQFDVQRNGAILNNSATNVQTQLGGWIQGNGNLAAGSARVILNEVNSSSPSQLKGFIEVAGQRAEVIIANPAGIAVDGGGFINASGATLTTGTPIINGGNLDGYRVQGGAVTISGAGLDASTTDFTNIIARAVQVNTGIWAKDLKVTTGANEVNAANTTATAIAGAGAAPAFAIDVAALGGMYAGKITLIGTEAGVGVNNSGTIAASSGDLVLQANGMLTNRGVLDGQTTAIKVDTLTNTGTGQIYGDHIAIQAKTLNNTAETVSGTTSAAVIAARNRLDIGAQTITNSDHSLILSAGDIAIGGTLDANREAVGTADTIRNGSATIEALGNLTITANTVTNANDHFAYSEQLINTQTGIYEAPWGNYYRVFDRYTYEPVVTQDDPAQLLAGGNITINATQINNQQSKIIAGGSLIATAATIDNQSVISQRRVRDIGTQWSWGVTGGHDSCYPCHWVLDWGYVASGYDVTAYTTMTVASGVSGNNRNVNTTQARSTATVTSGQNTSSVLGSALFHNTTSPAASYLVETNPRFTGMRQWLGSDYMLASLALDPSVTQKRLGDGFYEQRLINEQVAQLTGRRFLDNYTSDEQQYQALMNAGVTYAKTYSLRPGIALSAEQIAKLTSDIVWLVERTVTLPDGSQKKALVPQVYAMVRDGDLQSTGALLSGKSVQLASNGDITNSGIISAQQLSVSAANLNNNAGTIQGQQVVLATARDINNNGGTITAQDSLSLVAGGDINNTTATRQASGSNRTTLDRQAVIAVTGKDGQTGGQLAMAAAGDINLTASKVQSAGSAQINAGGSVNLNAATTSEVFHNESHGEAEFRQHLEQSTQTGSTIQTKGDLGISAGQNITGTAATVGAEGRASLVAGNAVSFVEGRSTRSDDLQWVASDYDFFSRTDTATRIANSQNTAIRGQISGTQGLEIQAGNVVQLSGQQLRAEQGDMRIRAQQVVIASAMQVENHSSTSESKKTGVSWGDFTGFFKPGQGLDHQLELEKGTGTASLAASTLDARNITISTTPSAANTNTNANSAMANTANSGITLVAAQLNATGDTREGGSTPGRVTLDAGDGSVHLAAVQTSDFQNISRKESDLAWQSASGSGHQDQNTQYTKINGELTLNAARVSVDINAPDAPPPATAGGISMAIAASAPNAAQQSLQQSTQALAQQPGMAWLGQLQSDPALAAKVNWNQLEEIHKNWHYDQQGLSPAGAVVLAAVVTYFSAGAASEAATSMAATAGVTGAAATATTAAMTAAMQALMSQTAVAMVNNGGDIGKTLTQLGSEQSIKGLLTAMVTAGALNRLGLNTAQVPGDFSGNVLNNLRSNLTSSAIDAAINGKPFDENTLATSLKGALITAGMAAGANAIGDAASATFDANGKVITPAQVDAFTQKLAHAVLGCAGGAVTAGNASGCAPGAVGAVVGEMTAQFYNPDGKRSTIDTVNFVKMMSSVAGALVGGGDVQAVNIAATTGANAAENNYLKHADAARLASLTQACSGAGGATCTPQQQEELAALVVKDKKNDTLLNDACNPAVGGNPSSPACSVQYDNLKTANASYNNYQGMGAQDIRNELGNIGKITQDLIIYNPETNPSSTGNGRDRLTGLPLDSAGRYTIQVALGDPINGYANYTPKYTPCATTDCIRLGQNLDMSDVGTQKYVMALDAQVFKDINTGATIGTIATPVGVAGNIFAVLGPATSLAAGYTEDKFLTAFSKEALQLAAAQYLKGVYGLGDAAVNRITATVDLAGGWQAFVDRMKVER